MNSVVLPALIPEVKSALELTQMLEERQGTPELLKEIINLLENNTSTLSEFLATLLIKLHNILGSDLAFIGLVTEIDGKPQLVVKDKDRHVIVGAWLASHPEHNYLYHVAVGGSELPDSEKSFTGYVAATGESLCIEDVSRWSASTGFYRESCRHIKSELAVPILFEDRDVLGVINLESKELGNYTIGDKKLVEWVARLIARPLFALMNRAGYKKPYLAVVDRINRELQRLTINVDLNAKHYLSSDSKNALDLAMKEVGRALSSGSCQVYVLSKDRTEMALAGVYGPDSQMTLDRATHTIEWDAIDQRCLLRCRDSFSNQPMLVAPLLSRAEAFGVIRVTLRSGKLGGPNNSSEYTLGDERTLSVFQQNIAVQLDMKYQEWQRRVDAVRRQQDVAALLAVFAESNLETVLNTAINKLIERGAAHCSMFLYDKSRDEFVRAASSELPPSLRDKTAYKKGPGSLTGWCGTYGRTLLLRTRRDSDLKHVSPQFDWEDKDKALDAALQDRPFMAVPILLENEVVGVIRCTDKRGEQELFTEADEQLASLIASHIATTLAFRRRYDWAVTLIDNFKHILAKMKTLDPMTDVNAFESLIFTETVKAARTIFVGDLAIIYRYQDEDFLPIPILDGELKCPQYLEGHLYEDSIVFRIIDNEEQAVCFDDCLQEAKLVEGPMVANQKPSRGRFVVRENIRSSVAVRLHAGDHVKGVLFINYRSRNTFTPRFREMVSTFSEMIGLCFEVAGLYRSSLGLADELHNLVIPDLYLKITGRAESGITHLDGNEYGKARHDLSNIEYSSQDLTVRLCRLLGKQFANLTRRTVNFSGS